jgi:hypothetical protein
MNQVVLLFQGECNCKLPVRLLHLVLFLSCNIDNLFFFGNSINATLLLLVIEI